MSSTTEKSPFFYLFLSFLGVLLSVFISYTLDFINFQSKQRSIPLLAEEYDTKGSSLNLDSLSALYPDCKMSFNRFSFDNTEEMLPTEEADCFFSNLELLAADRIVNHHLFSQLMQWIARSDQYPLAARQRWAKTTYALLNTFSNRLSFIPSTHKSSCRNTLESLHCSVFSFLNPTTFVAPAHYRVIISIDLSWFVFYDAIMNPDQWKKALNLGPLAKPEDFPDFSSRFEEHLQLKDPPLLDYWLSLSKMPSSAQQL